MKITGMTTRVLEVEIPHDDDRPTERQPRTSYYPLTAVHTDEGIDGYTMAYGSHRDGHGIGRILHDTYFEEIEGTNPLHVRQRWTELMRKQRHMYALRDAFVGVLDVAFWDLLGKAHDAPISTLLGVARERLPAYLSTFVEPDVPEDIAEDVVRVKEAGYHGYKLKYPADTTPLDVDVASIRAAREAGGQEFALMRDAVAGYSVTQAERVGRVCAEENFEWFEEPISDRELDNLAHLAREVGVPILAGETARLDEVPDLVRERAVDIARGDVYLKAGITGLRKVISTCDLAGFDLEIHSAATPLLNVANLHVACSTDNCRFWEVLPGFDFALAGEVLDLDDDGYVHRPTGPGLGVDLDWDWIEDHTIEVIED